MKQIEVVTQSGSRKKGIVLVVCLYFAIILVGLSGASFIRVVSESRNSVREKNRIIAFYNAEAGLAYGYAELAKRNFNWYTMDEFGNPIDAEHDITNSEVSGGIYTVVGQSFSVKSYPEYRNSQLTGTIVLRSQGVSNGTTRTLEYRVAQESAYQYFFFFPGDMTFGGGATYNGRNYGGIHVNGNITFSGSLYLKYLTKLTSSGYMSRAFNSQRPNLSGSVDYPTSSSSVTNIPNGAYFYGSNYYLFDNSSVQFTTGNYTGGPTITPLQFLSGDGAAWTFDEYAGSSTSTFQYNIGNEDLTNLAIREALTKSDTGVSGYNGIFDTSKTIEVAGANYNEQTAFQKAYEAYSTGAEWNVFWAAWKTNHANDYSGASGLTSSADLDWQRRFFQAAYNWGSTRNDLLGTSTYSYRNAEWLSDMVYGNDRSDGNGDLEQAAAPYTGSQADSYYYLNTQHQGAGGVSSAWGQYLATKNLDEEGDDKTYVADQTQGGQYIDTGDILNSYTDTSTLKEKAQNGGIYIGPQWTNPDDGRADFNNDYSVDFSDFTVLAVHWGQTTSLGDANGDGIVNASDLGILLSAWGSQADFVNPIADCTVVASFFNSQNPGRKGSVYEPSAVLKIDVNALKNKIEAEGSPLAGFNGIIYVNLPSSQDWSGTGRTDYKADGVMLTNGEVLPAGGLSLVTVNNVYMKGSFNLDATGDTEKNRAPDNSTVLNNAINDKDYLNSTSDFSWQPAEIITSRYLYALSNEFPEPTYMPMSSYYPYEYYEENSNNTVTYDYVNNLYYPTDSWVPAGSTVVSGNSILSRWFSYTGTAMPSKFNSTWINTNWSDPNQVFSFDTNSDGTEDTWILANDLRSAVINAVDSAYRTEFAYNSTHPEEISLVNTVSKPYVYNTAIVSPYSVSASVLENWNPSNLTVNGAFIQLLTANRAPTPNLSNYYYYRYGSPSSRTFNYESRYGKNSSASDRPNTGLTFGADSSWREVSTF